MRRAFERRRRVSERYQDRCLYNDVFFFTTQMDWPVLLAQRILRYALLAFKRSCVCHSDSGFDFYFQGWSQVNQDDE